MLVTVSAEEWKQEVYRWVSVMGVKGSEIGGAVLGAPGLLVENSRSQRTRGHGGPLTRV